MSTYNDDYGYDDNNVTDTTIAARFKATTAKGERITRISR